MKKHIIITGSRGSGKSTLLKNILNEADFGSSIPGIITWCEKEKAVYMQRIGSADKVTVGVFNPDSTAGENRMNPVEDGFNVQGVYLLNQLIEDDSPWIYIDEIGYLESTCDKYIEKLNQAFEKKRIIAVVRKQETELLKKLISRQDALVVDLDAVDPDVVDPDVVDPDGVDLDVGNGVNLHISLSKGDSTGKC